MIQIAAQVTSIKSRVDKSWSITLSTKNNPFDYQVVMKYLKIVANIFGVLEVYGV